MFSTLGESHSTLDASCLELVRGQSKSEDVQKTAELRSLTAQNVAVQTWSREEVLYLLELYKDKMVWEQISKKMVEVGYNYMPSKCEIT